jgi:hypothetical protein
LRTTCYRLPASCLCLFVLPFFVATTPIITTITTTTTTTMQALRSSLARVARPSSSLRRSFASTAEHAHDDHGMCVERPVQPRSPCTKQLPHRCFTHTCAFTNSSSAPTTICDVQHQLGIGKWRVISLAAIPGVGLLFAWNVIAAPEPEVRVEYPYMHIRSKDFFWGKKALFEIYPSLEEQAQHHH